MYKQGNAVVTTPIVDPGKWLEKKVPASRVKIANSKIAAFDPSKWLLSHVTIIASVDVDIADSGKCKKNQYNYLIKPEYSLFVNNNGDSWERDLLKGCYKTFLGADNFCFAGGTRVLMADGTYKPIDFVVKGDRVINRKGEIGTVTNTFERETNDIYEIKSTSIMSRSLFVSGNHPFWMFHARETCPKTGRPNIFEANKSFSSLDEFVGFSVGVHRAKGEYFESGMQPVWKEAKDIDFNRDFLTKPVSSVEIECDEINENRAELIGWFLAEGSYTNNNIFSDKESGIQFSLGNEEQDIAERLKGLLAKEFGEFFRIDCEPRVYETESGSINLFLCNAKVAEFFFNWCGKYSWAKKLNEQAMWLPKKLQAIILSSCLNGDGCGKVKNRGYSIELKSKDLIQQLMGISWRLGTQPVYKETGVLKRYSSCEMLDGFEVYVEPDTGKRSRPGYLLRYTTTDSSRLYELCNKLQENIKAGSGRKTHTFKTLDGEWMLSKGKKVTKFLFDTDTSIKVYNIEVDNDNSYVVEGVCVHNCEHVQIPELSKGKVIDVALREIPFTKKNGKDLTTLYADILIATNRKHIDLVEKIISGEYNSTSMGCLIKYSQCSQCGNIAEDDTQACNHVRFFKNNYFYDPNGVRRIIAELCGRSEEPDSCKFIDASWVRKPAFEGAVLRNILDVGSDNQDVSDKIKNVINIPSFMPQEGMLLRAASEAASALMREINAAEEEAPAADAPTPPADDSSFPEPSGGDTPPLTEDTPPDAGDEPADPAPEAPADPAAAPGGAEAPADPAAAAPEVDEPINDATTKEVRDMLKKQVLNKIRKELLEEEAKAQNRPIEMENDINDNLVKESSIDIEKEAVFKKIISSAKRYANNEKILNGLHILDNLKSWKNISKYGYSREDVLGLLYHVDRTVGANPVGADAVKALSKIRLASNNLKGFFTEMIIEIGRKPTASEAKKLAGWGRILSNFD